MKQLSLSNIITGKMMVWIASVLALAVVGLGLLYISSKHDNELLTERINTKDQIIGRKSDKIIFYEAELKRDKLDALAKDAEYNRTMAEKPKYITQIKYIPTGDKCADYEGIIDEARANKEGRR